MENKEKENKLSVSFAAIEPYVADNIIKNIQKEVRGKDIIEYGERNLYPQYLYDLFENVSLLKSIINGIADYVGGEEIKINIPLFTEKVNSAGDTIEDLVRQIVLDYGIYGGFALNVLRNRFGKVAEVYVLDFKNVRSNKKNTMFYYSEDWGEKSIGRVMATKYPKFDPNDKAPSSIYYYKADRYNTYPSPGWSGAVEDAECLKHISEFHLNSLYNGLSSDYIINFNNGVPTDEQKAEIEENIDSKYTGFQNGSRSLICFNPDMTKRTTIEAIPQSNFIDRYNAMETTAIKNVFTAFRIHPALFGLPTDNSGFNSQDIEEAFKVANKTIILPIQKTIKRAFEYIFGEKEVITIKPFEIEFGEEKENKMGFVQ